MTSKSKSREQYQVTWQWYQYIKGDTLANYSSTEKFDTIKECKDFLKARPCPSKGMKLRYRIDRIITQVVEEVQ